MEELIKVKIKIGDLFSKLNITKLEELSNVDGNFFVPTPDKSTVRILGFVKKEIQDRYNYLLEDGSSITCSPKHLIIDETDSVTQIKNARFLTTMYGLKRIKSKKKLEEDYVYDISIPSPHLYVTPNGIIHHNTTLSKAICNDIGLQYITVNASSDANIDFLRDQITSFARSVSFNDKKKVIILDEADGVKSMQFFDAMRPTMEQFIDNCTFIFTANNFSKIPPAIKSRLVQIEFKIENKKEYAGHIYKRCSEILKTENVEFDPKILQKIVIKYFPDFRSILNVIQDNRDFLKDTTLENRLDGLDASKIFDAMVANDFNKIRDIVQSELTVIDSVYTQVFKQLLKRVNPDKIPEGILVIDDFMRQHNSVSDKEIHVIAFIMSLQQSIGNAYVDSKKAK